MTRSTDLSSRLDPDFFPHGPAGWLERRIGAKTGILTGISVHGLPTGGVLPCYVDERRGAIIARRLKRG